MNTRRISYDILLKIEKEDLYVSELLETALRQLQFSDKRDRAFITRIVEGVIERKISLDFLIDKFSKKGSTGNSLKTEIRIVLRMGIYQIRYMDSVPDRAAVAESVKLVRELGFAGLTGYVNGLLRKIAQLKEEGKLDSFLVSKVDTRYSTPQWLCDFLVEKYGKDDARLILEDQYKEHDTVIRINLLKTDKEKLRLLLEEAGIEVSDGILSDRCLRIKGYDSIRRIPGYRDGLFIVQDETSVKTIESIGIKPGDKVLDLCASPGGKTLLAYELACPEVMEGQKDNSKEKTSGGVVVSRDVSENKLVRIRENAERLGIAVLEDGYGFKGIKLEVSDATTLDTTISELPDDKKFDVVIADVPCSGLGIIGRKNDIKYHMSPEIMKTLSEQGLVILRNASRYVKKGGRICFSTCTINPAENGEVVRRFIDMSSDYDVSISEDVDSDSSRDADTELRKNIDVAEQEKEYKIIEEKTFLQGIDGSDGFYFCIIEAV